MSFLIALIDLAILFIEGWLIAGLLTPVRDRWLRLSFSLPLATISNVLLFFLYTVLSIPLSAMWLGVGHTMIILIVTIARYLLWPVAASTGSPLRNVEGEKNGFVHRSILVLCIAILTNIFLFSSSHALLLPTISIDSLTNWTMRSQISFYDQEMAFDLNEDRGMSKPQYPFLTHALQIAANQGQSSWNDRAANAVTWLLSLSCFTALFLILQKLRGMNIALVAITLIASIPLLSIHLAQGYGDVHLVEYLLLALACLALFIEAKNKAYLLLSAIFVLGGMWTKSEGLYFGFALWALLLLILAVHHRQHCKVTIITIVGTLALFVPFLLLLTMKRLPLTPHETDAAIAWHPEGLSALLPSLFGSGSFGTIWYALPIASLLLVISARHSPSLADRASLPLLLWGWLIVAENLFIYLFTPNVVFLVNGESFFRQMMPAAALIILACAFIIRPNPIPNPNPIP